MSLMATVATAGCELGEACDWSTPVSGLDLGADSGCRCGVLLFNTDRLQPGGFSIPRGEPSPNPVVFFLRTVCTFSYRFIRST
jgi:hypothetical protein